MVPEIKHRFLEYTKSIPGLLLKYWLLIYFIFTISYLELIYKLWNFKGIGLSYAFPVLFAMSAGAILYLFSSLFSAKVNKLITVLVTLFLILAYGTQLIYYCVFRTPLSLYSLTGTGDTLQFKNVILGAILKNLIGLILLFVPLIYVIVFGRKYKFTRIKPLSVFSILFFFCVSYTIVIVCVNLTGHGTVSQYTSYYKDTSTEISVNKLGLLTTMHLDLKRLVSGNSQSDSIEAVNLNVDIEKDIISEIPSIEETSQTSSVTEGTSVISNNQTTSDSSNIQVKIDNILNIDFETLIANEKDQNLLAMHKYFSSVMRTAKNEYSGIFKGDNLILITAESFSPYAINPTLTPTLYKMSKEGFVFNNFYNPLWAVSTTDGEYVACTGLLPKSGVWSFAASGKNYLPLCFGNQFKELGYITKAYHDHSYSYYKRDISHPNMGYDYKAVGNGLKIKKTWPESDLEMINVTTPEYIDKQPFHIYYMTVSGHLEYNFGGNSMANKNKALVTDLPYSNAAKAYVSCNLELEFAMKALVEKLEAAGIADKTVIAISPDHYPYGLPRECIDELAGHKVENNFEIYKSTFILWKEGMKPVSIDKPCSSLDINPTLSNLFGLDYDSRLLMGRDILSDSPGLVIFSNRSWITDRAWYNSITSSVSYKDSTEKDAFYETSIDKEVSDKFLYSAKILETDYYKKVFPKEIQSK